MASNFQTLAAAIGIFGAIPALASLIGGSGNARIFGVVPPGGQELLPCVALRRTGGSTPKDIEGGTHKAEIEATYLSRDPIEADAMAAAALGRLMADAPLVAGNVRMTVAEETAGRQDDSYDAADGVTIFSVTHSIEMGIEFLA